MGKQGCMDGSGFQGEKPFVQPKGSPDPENVEWQAVSLSELWRVFEQLMKEVRVEAKI